MHTVQLATPETRLAIQPIQPAAPAKETPPGLADSESGRSWSTARCGRCGSRHLGYPGRLDARGVEYVVCRSTGLRLDVDRLDTSPGADRFKTFWVRDAQ